MLRSTDSGDSWSPQTSATEQHLFGLWANNKGEAYAIGAKGTIMYSSDDGKTWATQKSGAKSHLFGIWGDDKEVIVVGYNGTILRSKDHKTWTKISSGTTEHLVSVWSDGAGKHYAVGAAGSVVQF